MVVHSPTKESPMTWTKPEIKEIVLAMEVTYYVNAR
ncbi:MAG: pyrroloquinoline quinone precursor peptide PqqA [Acidobacteria bacterium]|nr:pyrroloquinoline quinone precursor peptide PqqA [Acidobacteriota bacterium]